MLSKSKGTIVKVSGPLVIAEGMRDAEMFDVVRVSDKKLIGEIIEMHGDRASIQVYEDTAGLGPGEPVVSEGAPLSVELAPGLIGQIFDGIQRPLDRLVAIAGNNIARGVSAPAIDRDRSWVFQPVLASGATVVAGDILGTVQETELVLHKVMVPPGLAGTLESIKSGDFQVTDTIAGHPYGQGRYGQRFNAAEMARSARPSLHRENLPERTAGHRPACHRHLLPGRQRRHRDSPRPIRQRQDRHPAPAGQMGGIRYRRLHRLRRTRQ